MDQPKFFFMFPALDQLDTMKKYYHTPSSVDVIDAAQRGDVAAVQSTLEADSSQINACDERGYSAYHWAAYSDDVDVFNLLLSINANALWELKTKKGQNCLHIACSAGSLRVVSRIIALPTVLHHINDVNQHSETALHLAAAAGNTELTKHLLGCGIDTQAKDQWGRTAHQVARENGYTKTASAISALCRDETKEEIKDESAIAPVDRPVIPLQSVFASELRAKLATGVSQRLQSNLESTDATPYVSNLGLHHTVPNERHMFADSTTLATDTDILPHTLTPTSTATPAIVSTPAPIPAPTTAAPAKPKMSLSKLVEFPGDPVKLKAHLEDQNIALNGKDMYGLTALMKFAAWDKVDLVEMLLPRLSAEEVNTTGGKQKLPVLHYCVDMDAVHTLRALLRDTRVDQAAVDEHGRTFRQHAKYFNRHALVDAISK